MVINNWFVVIDNLSIVVGSEGAWWIRLFFTSFWVIVVLLLMNIIIAIVIEIHDSLTQEIDENFK